MKTTVLASLACLLILAGCSGSIDPRPVPPEKAAYIGVWKSADYILDIAKDGTIKHETLHSTSLVKTMTAPLREFEGNNFEVGIVPMTRTYVVSVPPHEEGGVFKMTVDDIEYTRAK